MDGDERGKEQVLNIILIGSIATAVAVDGVIFGYSLAEGSAYRGIPFPFFSLLPAAFTLIYVLSRRGFPTLASYLLIIVYMTANSYAAYRWGVTLEIVLITYALIIVTATILRGARFGFFITGAIAAFILPVWYAQFHGIIPMDASEDRDADALVFAILYFLIMIVAWLYDREVRRSLARAQKSEQALREERDMLEANVARRTEELRIAQIEQMDQLGRFAELGQLSSGLFHDIFNLLNAIALRGDESENPALESAYGTTKQIKNFMEAVHHQIDHRDSIKEEFSLSERVECALHLVSRKAQQSRVTVAFARENDARCFNAPLKFHRVVVNLLMNAIESYEGLPQGDLRERVVRVVLSTDGAGTRAFLQVADNGAGISKEIQEKVFEPFFTTKAREKGTGIGLAVAKKIVEEDFHGTIAVQSAEKRGTAFTVAIPLADAPPEHGSGRQAHGTHS